MTDAAPSLAEIKASLDHPVIDVDGHVIEYLPAVEPFVREALAPDLFARWQRSVQHGAGAVDPDTRRSTRLPQGNWWGTPALHTLDLATAAVPALLDERLPDLGIDFAVLYPSKGLGAAAIQDGDLRRGVCRGFNDFYASAYGPYRSRLTVAGMIPMHSPEEAVAEIEHCAAIGLAVVAMPEGVLRLISDPGRIASNSLLPGQRWWLDSYGLDSEYDYDPVWETCRRLRLPVSFHAGLGTLAPAASLSITNYSYNHVGRFADRMSIVCKSLFFGGVTRRFPDLRFAFLECGVGWAAILLSGLVEHFEKRNARHLREHLNPDLIDWAHLGELMSRYGASLDSPGTDFSRTARVLPAVGLLPAVLDDWAALGAQSEEDIIARFVPSFFFGCEADDTTTAFAFTPRNPHGARLRPVFSSDIGHWDVTDMRRVVPEAFGLVRRGLLSSTDFADFVFGNPVAFLAGDDGFFDKTDIAAAVRTEQARQGPLRPNRPR